MPARRPEWRNESQDVTTRRPGPLERARISSSVEPPYRDRSTRRKPAPRRLGPLERPSSHGEPNYSASRRASSSRRVMRSRLRRPWVWGSASPASLLHGSISLLTNQLHLPRLIQVTPAARDITLARRRRSTPRGSTHPACGIVYLPLDRVCAPTGNRNRS